MVRKRDLETELAQRMGEIDLLMKKVQAQQTELETYKDRERAVINALAEAKDTATRMIEEAQERVDSMYAESKHILGNAHTEADAIREAAQAEATQTIENAKREAETIRESAKRESEEYVQRAARLNSKVLSLASQAREYAQEFERVMNGLSIQEDVEFLDGEAQISEDAEPAPCDDPKVIMQNIYAIEGRGATQESDVKEEDDPVPDAEGTDLEEEEKIWTVDEVAPNETSDSLLDKTLDDLIADVLKED